MARSKATVTVDDLRVLLEAAFEHARNVDPESGRGVLLEVILRVAEAAGLYQEFVDTILAEAIA